ncbi:hypothetical protein ACKGJO_05230 [Gracilimonas sp. Q87]|uniref:hypothetical protein n=1 Tax=Gracilimonas sp. Q87 TaxID=3384766 RepID=UPI003984418B
MNLEKPLTNHIKQLSTNALDFIYKSGAMGIFKKGTKEPIFAKFLECDIQELLTSKSLHQYDQTYDQIVKNLHQSLFPLYMDNLKIQKNNPYSYTARLLNQYIKLIFQNLSQYNLSDQTVEIMNVIHPIISNKFIEQYLPNIKSIAEIDGHEMYYELVENYNNLVEEEHEVINKQLLCMLQGIDV